MGNKHNSEYKSRLTKESIKRWELLVPKLRKFIKEKSINVIDVGAAEGESLLTFHNKKFLNRGFLVEKFWQGLLDEHLLDNQMDNNYYLDRNIEIFPVDGLDKSIPYPNAEMVIMTYCEGVMWRDLYPRIKNAKYIIAEDAWGGMLFNQPDLEMVYNFSLYPQSAFHKDLIKMRGGKVLPYYLFKRK